MAKENQHSTILSEHKSVVTTRYTLSLINFVAILLGTLVTLFFVQRRGIYQPILLHIYALIGINVLQILLGIAQLLLRTTLGKNFKLLTYANYFVGVIWVAVTVSELVVATVEIGSLRVDLLAVAAIQFVIALVAYFVWPSLDRRAIDAMIRPSVRNDGKKKRRKARAFIIMYGLICAVIVLAQATTLFVYKMPPQFYDLFDDTRAVQYKYDKAMDGYVVKAVYRGTATTVNIPATYNNKPVVGIATGALVDENITDRYKLTEITFGTPETDADGNTVMKSNLLYISAGAINSADITELSLPASIERVDERAIISPSLKTIHYSAAARFSYSSYDCATLTTVTMSGENVGTIASLEGMPSSVSILVEKNIYNTFRQANMNYGSSFRPILAEDEYCIDFFTDCDYYIDSIFCKLGDKYDLHYSDLRQVGNTGTPLSVDTEAYIKNPHELNTNGARADSAFRGWYLDEAFTYEFKFTEYGSDPIDKSIQLYAKWIPEYTGTLDWGTYKPLTSEIREDGSIEVMDELHWTDEDVAVFPEVRNRAGYTKGVVWTLNGNPVKSSSGISESVTLNATWLLDAPTVAISQNTINAIAQNDTRVQFVYDENTTLTLTPDHSHVLQNGRKNEYTYEWTKNKTKDDQMNLEDSNLYAAYQTIHNYVSGGDYTLTVTFESEWGEKASASIGLTVDILKKPLVLSQDFNLTGKTVVYNGQRQELLYTGEILSDNVQTTYRYFDENNQVISEGVAGNTGVKNAGKYKVEAIFEKNNSIEAANYEIKTLQADLVIGAKAITVSGWTNDDGYVYSGKNYTCTAIIEGLIEGEDAGLTYDANVQKNAGTYTTHVTGWNNKNYELDINDTRCSNVWEIEPKVLTVSAWEPQRSGWTGFSIVYDGTRQEILARPSGVITGDTVNFTYEENAATNANIGTGVYTARVTGTDNPNYTYDEEAANIIQKWSIQKRPLTVTFDNPSYTYNGTTQNLNATVSNFVSADKAVLEKLNTVAEVFDYKADQMTAGKPVVADNASGYQLTLPFGALNAGSYTAILNSITSDEIDRNYSVSSAQKSMTIGQRALTISVPATGIKTYNGANQTLQLAVDNIVADDLTSFKLEDFKSSVGIVKGSSSSGKFMLDYSFKDAASYPITISAFSGNPNYKLGASVTQNVIINKRTVTISQWQIHDMKADKTTAMTSDSYPYNYAGYEIGYVLSGVQGSDNVILKLANASGKNVASITTMATMEAATADNKNYIFESTNRTWAITPYELTVKWTFDQTGTSFVYDGTQRKATPSYDLLGDDTINLTYTGNAGKNKGAYTISVTGTGNANYVVKSGASLNWSITARPLTLTWTVPSDLVYTGQYQGPSFKLNNLIDGESFDLTFVTSLNSKVSGTSTGSVAVTVNGNKSYAFTGADGFAVDAGTYDITQVTLPNSSNYSITLGNPDAFTIAPRPLTLTGEWTVKNGGQPVTDAVYNKQVFTATTTIASGSVINHLGSSTTIDLTYSNNTRTDAGRQDAKVTGLTGTYAANYLLPTTGNTYTINIAKKVVNVVWTNHNFVFTGKTLTQTATIATGGANADDGKAYESIVISAYTGNTGTNAGTAYVAKATTLNNSNYSINATTASHNWSIAKCPVVLTWVGDSFTYNGRNQYPSASYTNPQTGEIVRVTELADHLNYLANTDGKKYTARATGLDNGNYTLEGATNVTKDYTITPLTIEVTWYARYDGAVTNANMASLIYNDKTGALYATVTNVCGDDEIDLTYKNNTFKDAKSYTASIVGITGPDAANYKIGASTKDFTVAKKPVSIVWRWDNNTSEKNPEFDGKLHTLAATISGAAGDDVLTPVYSQNTQLASGVSNVGTYTITVSGLSDNANYSFNTTEATRSMTISQQTVKVVWSGDMSVTYDGNVHTITAKVTGTENDKTVDVPFSYSNSFTNAGNHTVTVQLKDSNYRIDSDVQVKTLAIAKQKITVAWSGNETVNYDGNTHTLHVSITDGFGKNNNALVNKTGEGKNAGDYSIRVTLVDSNNYEFASNTVSSKTLSIKKHIVSVTWAGTESLVYDGQAHTLTATAKNNASIVDNTLIKVTGSGTNAGKYTISVALTDSGNYQFASGTVASKTLEIKKNTVTITWSGTESLVYDGASHTLTATAADVNGKTNNGLINVSGSGKNAGSYKISVALKDTTNYEFKSGTVTNKTLSIQKQAVTLAWTGATSYVYDGRPKTFTVAATGSIDGSNAGLIKTMPTFTDAGTHTVAATLSDSANYRFADGTTTQKSLTINPQAVKITWPSSTDFTYDGNPHGLKATVVGADDGKNVSFEYTGTATAINAGTYEMGITLKNGNYAITNMSDSTHTYGIGARVVEITWNQAPSVYDGQVFKPSATVTNYGTGDSAATLKPYYTTLYYKTENGSSSSVTNVQNAGIYRVTLTGFQGEDSQNYTIQNAENLVYEFTIQKRSVTVEWNVNDAQFVYDGSKHNVIASLYGCNNHELIQTVNVGSYTNVKDYMFTLEQTALTHDNYTLKDSANTTVSFKVVQKQLTLNWTASHGENWYYQPGIHQGYRVELSGVAEADKSGVSLTKTGDLTSENAGTYTIKITGLSGNRSGNYTIDGLAESDKTKTYTIYKQPVSVVWEDKASVVFEGIIRSRRFEVVGLISRNDIFSGVIVNYQGNDYANPGVGTFTRAKDLSNEDIPERYKANYEFTDASGLRNNTFTVTKGETKVEWYLDGKKITDLAQSLVYDGKTHRLTYRVLNMNGEQIYNTAETSAELKNVGTHSLHVEFTHANYHAPAENTMASLTITPKTVNASFSGYDQVTSFNGKPQTPVATLNGLITGESAPTLTYKYVSVNAENIESDVTEIVNVGRYRVYAQIEGNSNYAFSTSAYIELEIRATDTSISLSDMPLNLIVGNETRTFTIQNNSYIAGQDVKLVLSITDPSGQSRTINLNGASVKSELVFDQIGSYSITILSMEGADAGNYTFGSDDNIVISVDPAPVVEPETGDDDVNNEDV